MNKVVYSHTRKDNNKVFYIGMGFPKRPYTVSGRSKYWNNIVNKHGYYINVLASNLSKQAADELEVFLIKEYGRIDLGTGILVNMTEGGEGRVSWKMSDEQKNKLSNSRKGITAWNKGLKLTDKQKENSANNNPKKRIVIRSENGIEYESLKFGCKQYDLKYTNEKKKIQRGTSVFKYK